MSFDLGVVWKNYWDTKNIDNYESLGTSDIGLYD